MILEISITPPPHQSILNIDYLELNDELEVLLDLLCDLALEDWLLDLCSLEDLLTLDELLDDLEFVKELKDLQFSFFVSIGKMLHHQKLQIYEN